MKKHLYLFLLIFFSNAIILATTVNSQKPQNQIVNVSCRGTGDYSVRSSFNWFDDYTFMLIPEFDNKGKANGNYQGVASLGNCSHCMGRKGNYFSSDGKSTLIISYGGIVLKEFGDPTVNTTISRSSGNFSSIDTVQNGQTTVSRSGSCTNIDLLYSKIDELKNIKGSKSSSSPNKGTDSGVKDTLKKIIGK